MRKTITVFVGLVAAIFLSGIDRVFAQIQNPYVVDEKAQVIFGDSGFTVDGHLGLENYTTEYVGGYLHITYTYSHALNNFANFPPVLYITAQDPRTTATPTVRSEETVIPFINSGDPNPTDWYLYDIQFTSTGYEVEMSRRGVTQFDYDQDGNFTETFVVAGQTDTDWAALANNSPKATPTTNASMAFTPLLVHEEDHPASSDDGSSGSSSGRREERGRCVETNIGLYCPNEEVREYYIKHTMELLIGRYNLLIKLKEEDIF